MSRRKQVLGKKSVETRIPIGCEDMVLLPQVSEDGIVDNLTLRLSSAELYTNIGHVLVACNPYKWLDIYSEEYVKKYTHQQRVDVAPHIFSTAEATYRTMVTEEDNQCVIISGESGAGKTEASKQIQTYIAAVCGGGEGVEKLKRVFLESNPVLEAFGNAKTLRNNNSSRFGKYFELRFNRFGCPVGGVVTNYLLEKSRIVKPGPGERNFHIFYQLLASEYCKPLQLEKNPETYRYLSCSKCYTVEGQSDAAEFKVTLEAMRNVGMTNKQVQSVLTITAAVLHLGNVTFAAKDIGDAEGSKIQHKESLQCFCDLLQVDLEAVAHVMIFREMTTRGETYQVPQNPVQAAGRRDAISKALFERLFDLVVQRVNVALASSAQGGEELAPEDSLTIGVLDIYGFEVFQQNGFEQLCINYVNEKLQQIFIELTLRAEQEEYEREGIAWSPIPFFNNKVVCDLLDAARPAGIFRVLDDTVKTLHGSTDAAATDSKFVESVNMVHRSHKHYKAAPGSFVVRHYAGDVTYTCQGAFVESNKDSLNSDLQAALATSADKLVQKLFPPVVEEENNLPHGRKKPPLTASGRIRTQCAALVDSLMDCTPHYVRCIKSNDNKKALCVDRARVKHQAQYLGLQENIRVRRAGFAYRAEFHRFLSRFGILSPLTYPEWRGSDRDGCKKILAAASKRIKILTKEEAQLGKSKVFIRQPESYFALERLREVRLGDFVCVIQRCWRRYSGQREFMVMQSRMGKRYAKEQKWRRRDSIFRPFEGDYLDALGPDKSEDVREGMFRIVDHYDEKENVLFADCSGGQIIRASPGNGNNSPSLSSFALSVSMRPDSLLLADGAIYQRKLVVLTDKALYLCDVVVEKQHYYAPLLALGKDVRSLPLVLLRQRIPISGQAEGALSGMQVSRLADPCIALTVVPVTDLVQSSTASFAEDSSAKVCAASGVPFSMFNRRHHCRASGGMFVDECCNYLQALPHSGWYTPQRVCDSHVGLEPTDLAEDVLLALSRRTELIALLEKARATSNSNSNSSNSQPLPLSFESSVHLRAGHSEAQGSSYVLFSGPPPVEPLTPALGVTFSTGGGGGRSKGKGGGGGQSGDMRPQGLEMDTVDMDLAMSGSSGSLQVVSSDGISHETVVEKQKRQAKRQRRKAEKRAALDEERRIRAAVKEEQREHERQARLLEKKERKRAERAEKAAVKGEQEEAKKGKDQLRSASRGQLGSNNNSAKGQGEKAAVGGGAGSELAAALARRNANK